jgi:hypothetical protein
VKKRTYDALATGSLIAIALSAILYDRIPGYGWLFGGLAGGCALLSAWIYLAYGMNADRSNSASPDFEPPPISDREAIPSEGITLREGREIECLDPIGSVSSPTVVDAEFVGEKTERPRAFYADSIKAFQVKSVYYYSLASVEMPRQRTFAEEVVEIVKGLTALSDAPMYELEVKSDGTLKVIPCSQATRNVQERKSLEEDATVTKSTLPIIH